jgi:hypothetical protein
MELTTEGARAGYTNSVAEKSPEELLRMNRRGAKLKLPGSWKEKRTKLKTPHGPNPRRTEGKAGNNTENQRLKGQIYLA